MFSKILPFILFYLLILIGTIVAQANFSQRLYDTYPDFKGIEIVNKRFSHQEMMDVLAKYNTSESIEIKTAGYSVEGREIKLFRLGTGPINVLGWSQMHGDESTATMALLDILKFFSSDNDEFSGIKDFIRKNVSFYFVPMLNPDGTEKFTRRNEVGIDINRDALRLQFPESKILKSLQVSLQPVFSFNLHDQSTRYTAGNSYKVATISFLTPAFNHEKDMNDVRERSMKLIAFMKKDLDQFIPGHIARYSDDFEPRAFGDNFVKWGSGLVLIESGGWKNNYEKQFIRKINFITILASLNSIANGSYKNESIETYKAIPENQKLLFDLLLKKVTVSKNGVDYIIDIGINQNERGTSDKRDFYFSGGIEDIGDLSTFYGYEEINCEGMILENAKVYPEEFEKVDELNSLDIPKIVSQGYSYVKVDSIDSKERFTDFPINIVQSDRKIKLEFGLGRSPNFILKKNDEIIFVCVNGFLYDVRSQRSYIKNARIY